MMAIASLQIGSVRLSLLVGKYVRGVKDDRFKEEDWELHILQLKKKSTMRLGLYVSNCLILHQLVKTFIWSYKLEDLIQFVEAWN